MHRLVAARHGLQLPGPVAIDAARALGRRRGRAAATTPMVVVQPGAPRWLVDVQQGRGMSTHARIQLREIRVRGL